MCMYACINVLTKLMYFQQILYLLGVNKYYGLVMDRSEGLILVIDESETADLVKRLKTRHKLT